MKNEENFYDIIGSKFEDEEVPFDKEDWKSMKTMIDASRTTKRSTVFLMTLIGLLLCATGGILAFYKGNGVGTKSTASSTITSANSKLKESIRIKQIPNSATVSASANPKIASNISHTNLLIAADIVKKQTPHNEMSRNHTVTNTSQHQVSANHISHIANSGGQIIASNNVGSSGIAGQNEVAQGAGKNDLIATNRRVPTYANITTFQKPIPVSNTSLATTSSTKTTVKKTDSASTSDVLPQRFSDEPRIYGGKTNIFSVEVGTEYSGGWQIGSAIQGKGFNPIIGVGYAHYLGAKLFLKTGLQFSTFGNMSTLTYNYQHTAGNVIYDSVITTKRLYFLRIPVQVEYAIGRNKNSSIGLGGSAWFLLGNSGFATSYQQIDNNPPVNVEQYSQNTPLSGYSKINASAYGFYKYTFTHNFSMYGILYFEMTSMKENSFFGGDIIERTHGFQIMAAYSFN